MFSNEMKHDLVNGLCNIFGENLIRIILYGSVAHNTETVQSDIDIAIVLKQKMLKEKQDQFLLWAAELDLKYDRVFSIIDIAKENLDTWGNVLPFYRNVQKEGIVLWQAA